MENLSSSLVWKGLVGTPCSFWFSNRDGQLCARCELDNSGSKTFLAVIDSAQLILSISVRPPKIMISSSKLMNQIHPSVTFETKSVSSFKLWKKKW